MRLDDRENTPSPGLEGRIRKLEDTIEQVRGDLLAAIQAQRQLQDQLRSAVEEFSDALRQRSFNQDATPLERPSQQVQRLESRVRGLEQRLDLVAEQLTGILASRIWRTLIKGGGFLLRFTR